MYGDEYIHPVGSQDVKSIHCHTVCKRRYKPEYRTRYRYGTYDGNYRSYKHQYVDNRARRTFCRVASFGYRLYPREVQRDMYAEQHSHTNAQSTADSIARNAVLHQHKQHGKHSEIRADAYCQFWIHIDYFLLNIICYFRCPETLTHSFTVDSALATLRPFTGSPLRTLAPVASFRMSASPMPIRLPSCVIKGTIVLPEKS